MAMKPNPECEDNNCIKKQQEYKKKEACKPKEEVTITVDESPIHDDNPFEIEVVSETTEEELQAAEGDKPQLTEGVTVAYTKPAKPSKDERETVGDVSELSLEELMKQNQGL